MSLSEDELFSLFDLKIKPKRPSSAPLSRTLVLANVTPEQFEELVRRLYQQQGYDAKLTPPSRDGGVDVWAVKRTSTATERLAIQCKHQKSNVDRPTLDRLWGTVHSDHSVTQGVLVTSGDFTRDARRFAQGKRLKLIDGSALRRLMHDHGVATFAEATSA